MKGKKKYVGVLSVAVIKGCSSLRAATFVREAKNQSSF
jgi:hypothetical protein